MNQKIKDFELILEENQNEHIESIKNMKMEIENYKKNQHEHEKIFDILNYFFKKMQTYFVTNDQQVNQVNKQIDHKTIQNRLIDLENFIIKLINDKTAVQQKYSKVLDIQSKLTQSDSLDNSQYHLENVKKLNEKIYDLTDENNCLREQLNIIVKKEKKKNKSDKHLEKHKSHNSKDISTNNKDDSINMNMNFNKTDKENIFANNYIKEEKHLLNKNSKQNLKTINCIKEEDDLIKEKSSALLDNYKTLEQRVIELEKELKISILLSFNRLY